MVIHKPGRDTCVRKTTSDQTVRRTRRPEASAVAVSISPPRRPQLAHSLELPDALHVSYAATPVPPLPRSSQPHPRLHRGLVVTSRPRQSRPPQFTPSPEPQ